MKPRLVLVAALMLLASCGWSHSTSSGLTPDQGVNRFHPIPTNLAGVP